MRLEVKLNKLSYQNERLKIIENLS